MNSIGKFSYDIVNGCWECTSHKRDRFGYPRAGRNGINTPAHRIVWEMKNGEIPPGLLIRHTCDNPSCINPDHLLLGTHADNGRDKAERGRGFKKAPWMRGERNPKTKLKTEDVIEIRRLAGIVSQSALAKKYGIGQTTVSGIQRGVYWKFIGGVK